MEHKPKGFYGALPLTGDKNCEIIETRVLGAEKIRLVDF